MSLQRYIDGDKVCVWGWSYGGFVAGRVLAQDGDGTVQCGLAVAPVTQWEQVRSPHCPLWHGITITLFQYDTAYTERYMGLPSQQGNWRGYLQASLVAAANNIGDGQLLVVHGTQVC